MTGGRDANEVMDRAAVHGEVKRAVAHRTPWPEGAYGAVEVIIETGLVEAAIEGET